MSVTDFDSQMAGWEYTKMTQLEPQQLRKVSDLLDIVKQQIKDGESILDVGCGRGFVHAYLGQPENYLGIDINREEIEQARINAPGSRFECKNLFDVEGSWDVVLCSRVLMHIAPLKGAVEKLLSLAKRKLFLIISLRDEDSLRWEEHTEGNYWFRIINKDYFKQFGEHEIHHVTGKYSLVVFDRG